MKKQILVCLMLAMSLGGMVTSCDDNDVVIIPMETTTFNNTNGLELTYNGAVLLGKQAIFAPNSADASKATITLSGNNFTVEGLPFVLPGSGIIPGEDSLLLEVNLIQQGDMFLFEGTDETETRTITYKGSATKSFLKLDLSVTLAENPLTNKTIYLYKGKQTNSGFDPLVLDWCYMKSWGFDFDGDGKDDMYEEHAFNLFSPMFGLPLLNGMSIPDFLYGVLSEVKFLPDGNIQASYKDSPTDASYKPSPLNIATYQFVEDGVIRLFLNPDMIHYITTYTNTLSSRGGASDLTEGLSQAIVLISKCMKDGITMRYEKNQKGYLEFCIDDLTIIRPLLSILVPIIQSPAILELLEPMVKNNLPEDLVIMGMPVTPDFAWNMILGFIKSTPEMLKTTKYVNLGMAFSEEPQN